MTKWLMSGLRLGLILFAPSLLISLLLLAVAVAKLVAVVREDTEHQQALLAAGHRQSRNLL